MDSKPNQGDNNSAFIHEDLEEDENVFFGIPVGFERK